MLNMSSADDLSVQDEEYFKLKLLDGQEVCRSRQTVMICTVSGVPLKHGTTQNNIGPGPNIVETLTGDGGFLSFTLALKTQRQTE